ncbi:hypothetical protein N5P37_006651 [Trichoderma harzianum]|nr:hypothetical protein N5P37_006651 [Trichoderma harzianum]
MAELEATLPLDGSKTRLETIITLMSQANVEQDTSCRLVRPVNDARVAVTVNNLVNIAGSELPSSLQKQLDNITAHINYQVRNETSRTTPRPLSQQQHHVSKTESSFIPQLQAMSLAENDRINLSDLQFHGPSSSEYGLNIAQVMLRRNLQSLGEEAGRLHDYGGIDLGLRRGNSSHVDNDSMLLLNLVCSIALTAETTGISKIAQVFYESAQSAIQTNITARKLQIRDVVLVLLASIYHYFSDDIRLAWRLCGIAGRMVIELGIHRWEIFHQLFNVPSQRDKVASTIWTIVVLDRQWSCALGIPQNFQESDFDKRLPVPPALYAVMRIPFDSSRQR